MRRFLPLALTMGLTGGGLWLSYGLGPIQVWLFGAGLVGLVGIAAESFLDHPGGHGQGWSYYGFTAWVAAGLLVAAGIWLVQALPQDSVIPVAAVMATIAGVLMLGLREALQTQSRYAQPGRFLSNLIFYLLVFLLLALIYQTRLRSLVTATSAGVIASLVGLELLRAGSGARRMDWKLVVLAGLGGLIIAETSWVLNYWPVSGLVGGGLLLLCFYVVVGLLQCIRDGSLGRNEVLEYGVIGALGFLAILFAVP